MSAPPPLPREVSANGAEIWDWASRLSAWTHRQHRIRELRADIARVACGGCAQWMTRQCPREHNANGYSRGPSMNAAPCGQYAEKASTAETREKRRSELVALLSENKDSDIAQTGGSNA